MQLGMRWVFGFVRLAAGPIRAASECTGVLRTSDMSSLVYPLSPPHYAALSTVSCALQGVAIAMATLWEQWKGDPRKGLCGSFVERLEEVVARKGDRLNK